MALTVIRNFALLSLSTILILSCTSTTKNTQEVGNIKASNFVDFLVKCAKKYDLKTTDDIKKYCKGDYDGRLLIIEKYRNNLPLSETEKRLTGLNPPKDFKGDIASSVEWLKEEFTKPLMTIYLHEKNRLGVNSLEIYSLHKHMSAQLFISCVVSKFAVKKGSKHYYLGILADRKLKQNAEKTIFYAYFPQEKEKPSSDTDIEWTKPQPTNIYRDFCRKTIKKQYTW